MGLKEAEVLAQIEAEETVTLGKKTTAVILTLKNGFEIVGTSACVNAEEYSVEVGHKFARQRAIDKLWELEGYLSQSLNGLHVDRVSGALCGVPSYNEEIDISLKDSCGYPVKSNVR